MKTFEDLYFIMTAIWGLSPILVIAIFALFFFILFRTIKQTFIVATIRKRDDITNKKREVIGMIFLWILIVILCSPLIIALAAKIIRH